MAKEAQPSRNSKFGAGIQENAELTEVTLGETQSGKKFLDFIFTRKETQEFHNKRVWYPGDTPRVRDGETEAQAAQREVNEALEHIISIVETYLPSDKAAIMANNFEDFCKKAQKKLKGHFEGKKVRVKILYDQNGVYTQFAKFPPYVELQLEGQRSRLKISRWEQENRMTPADGPSTDLPFTNSNDLGPVADADDLPF